MNDVTEEQETVLVRVERVAGMTGSMTGAGRPPLIAQPPRSHSGRTSRQGPELRKVRFGEKALHSRLGNDDRLQVGNSTRPSGVKSPCT